MVSLQLPCLAGALALGLLSSSLSGAVSLEPRGSHRTGLFNVGAAEIVDYDAKTQRLFVVNGGTESVDVLDVSDVDHPTFVFTIDVSAYGSPNSVAVDPRPWVREIAIAVEADPITDPGHVLFYRTDGTFVKAVTVGALPDMVTYTPLGDRVLVANEGEPADGVDPEGTVTIIHAFWGGRFVHPWDVRTVDFKSLDLFGAPGGLRVFPGVASIARDVEPEYIALNAWGNLAWVTLQEANAVAIIDVWGARLLQVVPLGAIDHRVPGFGLDASDKDDAINIANWPVHGLFMPDGIASYQAFGRTFFITANEGDDRGENVRIKDLSLDPLAFPDAATLQKNENLGRLAVSSIDGRNADGKYEKLYSYGTRSFTIWNQWGQRIYDSGDDFETITGALYPDDFNSTNDENQTFEDRSDAKGPEPEGVTIGRVRGRTYAFIGLERIGGVMVYDVSNPWAPEFVDYANNRDFSGDPTADTAGDLGPEGLKFIPAHESPTHTPLLVVANEISGSTTIFEIVVKP